MSDLLIKICGVTSSEDAHLAVELGADRIGIVLYSQANRSVTQKQARDISDATKKAGGIPVGVFVDCSAEEVSNICRDCKIKHLQLHGKNSACLAMELSSEFFITLNIGVEESGAICSVGHQLLEQSEESLQYLLFDYYQPGSGKTFNHKHFRAPKNRPWILAGGLNQENIREAISLLKPDGIDVSTGVEGAVVGKKDPKKLREFINRVREI